ncbi:MAG: sugar ABC transporter ATP-binding protein, partial [Clostridiales bacterium]|nr:sugar ABC transporter ATP-binding protein [Clostridiales bacterium]
MEQLEFRNISKAFPGVQALDDVSFVVNSGRIAALMGENGAGKSTLLKILSGDLRADEGAVLLNGKELSFTKPYDAIAAGISVIYQERQLMPSLSVTENIFAGDLPIRGPGFLDKGRIRREAQAILDKFGLPIDANELVGRLCV